MQRRTSRFQARTLAIVLAAAVPAAHPARAEVPMNDNPFFIESPLPFHLPPFD
jgi:hypothetical protein